MGDVFPRLLFSEDSTWWSLVTQKRPLVALFACMYLIYRTGRHCSRETYISVPSQQRLWSGGHWSSRKTSFQWGDVCLNVASVPVMLIISHAAMLLSNTGLHTCTCSTRLRVSLQGGGHISPTSLQRQLCPGGLLSQSYHSLLRPPSLTPMISLWCNYAYIGKLRNVSNDKTKFKFLIRRIKNEWLYIFSNHSVLFFMLIWIIH